MPSASVAPTTAERVPSPGLTPKLTEAPLAAAHAEFRDSVWPMSSAHSSKLLKNTCTVTTRVSPAASGVPLSAAVTVVVMTV